MSLAPGDVHDGGLVVAVVEDEAKVLKAGVLVGYHRNKRGNWRPDISEDISEPVTPGVNIIRLLNKSFDDVWSKVYG